MEDFYVLIYEKTFVLMGVDNLFKFRKINSWRLNLLYSEAGKTVCMNQDPPCYLSTATHAIPVSADEVEIVGLNHIGEFNEQYAFFKLFRV